MDTSYEPSEEGILPSEFLTPDQRLDAITDILAAVTTRIIHKRHENQNSDLI